MIGGNKSKDLVFKGGGCKVIDLIGGIRLSFIFAMKDYTEKSLASGKLKQDEVESWIKRCVEEATGSKNTKFGDFGSFNTASFEPEISVWHIINNAHSFNFETVCSYTTVYNNTPLHIVIKDLIDGKNPEQALYSGNYEDELIAAISPTFISTKMGGFNDGGIDKNAPFMEVPPPTPKNKP